MAKQTFRRHSSGDDDHLPCFIFLFVASRSQDAIRSDAKSRPGLQFLDGNLHYRIHNGSYALCAGEDCVSGLKVPSG
jgi:hypothetical protein